MRDFFPTGELAVGAQGGHLAWGVGRQALGTGRWMMGTGRWMMGTGRWMMGTGRWMMGVGPLRWRGLVGGAGVDDGMLVQRKKRRTYSVAHEAEALVGLLGELPGELCSYKVVSFCDISAAAFVRFVAERTVIRRLSVSTFRIGPRALRMLSGLHAQGALGDARFVIGKVMVMDKRKTSAIEHYENLLRVCNRYGWQVAGRDNHTKLALFDTDAGKFVLEGSGNFNEAPNWEQFSFEQDEELYDFYSAVMDEMFATAPVVPEVAVEIEHAGEEVLMWPDQDSPLSW